MDKQQMHQLIEEVLRDADLHSRDIPAIDLYLDQILSLVADNRATASSYYRDKPLTKTMVLNAFSTLFSFHLQNCSICLSVHSAWPTFFLNS